MSLITIKITSWLFHLQYKGIANEINEIVTVSYKYIIYGSVFLCVVVVAFCLVSFFLSKIQFAMYGEINHTHKKRRTCAGPLLHASTKSLCIYILIFCLFPFCELVYFFLFSSLNSPIAVSQAVQANFFGYFGHFLPFIGEEKKQRYQQCTIKKNENEYNFYENRVLHKNNNIQFNGNGSSSKQKRHI